MRNLNLIAAASALSVSLIMGHIAKAASTVFMNRADWQTAAGASTNIDFATTDSGNPISNPANDVAFPSLTLKGATFLNVNSYYNQLVYNADGTIRVNLPANTMAVAVDLPSFITDPGTYTVTLSTGEVLTSPNAPSQAFVFFGLTSSAPLQWIEFNLNIGYLALDNFSYVVANPALQVQIDIRPGSSQNEINPINPDSKGVVPVSILSNSTFNATQVDPATVRFGRAGTEAPVYTYSLKDTNGDGFVDLLMNFKIPATGIKCGDTSARLTGKTKSGRLIFGSDAIRTVGCH